MSFEFANHHDAETFMSLKSLCKSNGGFFKSAKQAQFLFKRYSAAYNAHHTAEQVKSNFGIEVGADQILVTTTAYARWANYGARSIVPVMTGFVLDKQGVVAQYKISGKGNLRDGWGPDAAKTVIVWARDAVAVCPWTFPQVQEQPALPVSQHVGTPGEKISRTMRLNRRSAVASIYGDSLRWEFTDADGNIFVYFGTSKVLANVNNGDELQLQVKIKKHNVYNGVNQNVFSFR